jgi:hypothetical protein
VFEKKKNFGHNIRTWVKIFYKDINSCVINNGWTTKMFKVTRGVRQGCPLSPYLFIIGVEMLACALRQDKNIEGITIENRTFLINQYADDTTIFVSYNNRNIDGISKLFKSFQIFSGLKVNVDKTEIMAIGSAKHRDQTELTSGKNIKWVKDKIKTLGVTICHDLYETLSCNYNPLLTKIKNLIIPWSHRHPTIHGKVVIINSFLISQFIYMLTVLPSPSEQFMAEVEKTLCEFIWNGKREKIKRQVLKNSISNGGIKFPGLRLKDKSLKIAWLKRLITVDNKWNIFYTSQLQMNIETFLQCTMNNSDTKEILGRYTNPFIRDVFTYWFEFTFSDPNDMTSVLSQVLWFNSHIRMANKCTFNKKMYESGICYLSDILDENFTFIN